jgi:hypothetical protein
MNCLRIVLTSVAAFVAYMGIGGVMFVTMPFLKDEFLKYPAARALVTRLEEEPHVNPNTRTEEFSLRDPDGYYVTVSALSAA